MAEEDPEVAAGQVSLSWYDVQLELNAAPGRRLRMSELGQRAVLSRTRVSRVVGELAAAGLAERQAIRRHLGAQLTAQQCRQLAALLGQAAAGAVKGGGGQ